MQNIAFELPNQYLSNFTYRSQLQPILVTFICMDPTEYSVSGHVFISFLTFHDANCNSGSCIFYFLFICL